jgi:class 3 adenylate cyclase
MSYDYKQGKRNIIDILSSKTDVQETDSIPASDQEFTYDNGIKAWTSAIFIDIVDSTNLFKNAKQEKLARMMRAFVSELIAILKDDPNQRQIGIRGDCVFGIYSTPTKEDIARIFDTAAFVNAFITMYQQILSNYSLPTFKAGIGLGASQELIVKTGSKGTGINDLIWIGDAVVDASKLSSEANRDYFGPILMDSCFYENIQDADAGFNHTNKDFIKIAYSQKLHESVYSSDVVNSDFSNWISSGMKS